MDNLRKKIESAINRNSAENGSNTPDFILAEFLTDCLAAFDKAANRRKAWYGDQPENAVLDGELTPNFDA